MKTAVKYSYILITNLLFAKTIFAQSRTGGKSGDLGALPNPLNVTNIADLLNKIINTITLYVAPPIAVLMIIVGAFQILSAGGDPEKFKTGKKTIVYAAVGFGILLIANLLIGLIKEILGAK